MTTQLTSTGFQRDGMDVILARYQAAMIAIFGPDINLDPDTIDGETLAIFAEAVSNENQLAEAVYNSFNPSLATGAGLSRLVQINGISRIAGSYSTGIVQFSGVANTVIPANTLIGNPVTQEQFYTVAESTIGLDGTVLVACIATAMGAISAPVGAITKLITPQFGISSVTNLTAFAVGRAQETDSELRIRRKNSVAIASQALVDSLLAGILQVKNVVRAEVFENYTDQTDANGLPPHSVCCVVDGGSDEDVVNAIWRLKSLGVTTFGNTLAIATDVRGRGHQINFTRPAYTPIYVSMTITKKDGYPTTAPQDIKAAIVAWGINNQSIGEEVIYSRLYEPINSVAGFSVSSLTIGRSPTSMMSGNLVIGYADYASFLAENISITVL